LFLKILYLFEWQNKLLKCFVRIISFTFSNYYVIINKWWIIDKLIGENKLVDKLFSVYIS